MEEASATGTADGNTLYTAMTGTDGDTYVTGFHVCPLSKAKLMLKHQSAGGVVRDDACGAPTEQQCVTQVITERAPWAPRDPNADRPVTEFGVGAEPTYFGRPGDVVVQFKIKAKYVRFGSATEGGWCALKPAPIRDVKPYQKKK